MAKKTNHVKIVNGDLIAYVLPESLSAWQSNGWTVAETGDDEAAQVVDEPSAEAETEKENG